MFIDRKEEKEGGREREREREREKYLWKWEYKMTVFCLQNTGWWTYEYCHGDYIRQYHSEGKPLTRLVCQLKYS